MTISAFLEDCFGAAPEGDAVTSLPGWFVIRSHLGKVREENQDRVGVACWPRGNERDWVAVVSDGIGGGKAGGQAAAAAVADFIGALVANAEPDAQKRLADAAKRANGTVHRRWRGKEGATLSAVLVTRHGATSLNIGDSRIYGIQADGQVEMLTRDDVHATIPGLLNFVGMGEDLTAHTRVLPDSFTRLLLTTDGTHGYLHPMLAHLVRGAGSEGSVLVRRMTTLALWCGGVDNATTALVELGARPSDRLQSSANLDVWTPGIHHRLSIEAATQAHAVKRKRRKPRAQRASKGAASSGPVPRPVRGVVVMRHEDEPVTSPRGAEAPPPTAGDEGPGSGLTTVSAPQGAVGPTPPSAASARKPPKPDATIGARETPKSGTAADAVDPSAGRDRSLGQRAPLRQPAPSQEPAPSQQPARAVDAGEEQGARTDSVAEKES